MHFVGASGAIESFPPREVCFAAKAAVHRFDDVTRVGKNLDLARLGQRFEAYGGGCDLRLLVRRCAKVFADGAPVAFVTEQGDSRRALRLLSVAETRSVAENCYLFDGAHVLKRSVFFYVSLVGASLSSVCRIA